MTLQENIPFYIAYLNQKADELIHLAAVMDKPCFIAIDGRCASGKTTFAEILSEKSGWPVVHLDDFFLRKEQRSPERYGTPGENIDWERLLEEVITPLEQQKDAVFRRFDCSVMELGETITVPCAPVIVFEGSYALNPHLRDHFHLKVFMDVAGEEQLKRILARSNEAKLERFRNEWIPLEEKYFTGMNIRDAADIYINTSMQEEL